MSIVKSINILIRDLKAKRVLNPDHISDGYHTFEDLYRQRMYLTAALCNTWRNISWKSKKHSDGKECFGGDYFIVGIDTPKGQYTYHYRLKYWDLFQIPELEVGKPWDGHTSQEIDRLLSLGSE